MINILIKFYSGNITLWKSYWLVGELLNALLILAVFNIEIYLLGNNIFYNSLPFLDFNNFSFISKIILICWTIFITIGIWKSAENYTGSIVWIVATFIFLSYRLFSLRLIFFG